MASKGERMLFRYRPGGLVPFDDMTVERFKQKGYVHGDILSMTASKARNPDNHSRIHQLGALVASNVDDFHGMDAHAVIKRLQYEADVGCDHMMVKLKNFGLVEVRIPRSLAFSEMEDGEFNEMWARISNHISKEYWPDLDVTQIGDMAKLMRYVA